MSENGKNVVSCPDKAVPRQYLPAALSAKYSQSAPFGHCEDMVPCFHLTVDKKKLFWKKMKKKYNEKAKCRAEKGGQSKAINVILSDFIERRRGRAEGEQPAWPCQATFPFSKLLLTFFGGSFHFHFFKVFLCHSVEGS